MNLGHLGSSGPHRALLTTSTAWPSVCPKLMFIWAFPWSFAVFFLHLSYTVLLTSRHFIFIHFASVMEFVFPLYFLIASTWKWLRFYTFILWPNWTHSPAIMMLSQLSLLGQLCCFGWMESHNEIPSKPLFNCAVGNINCIWCLRK